MKRFDDEQVLCPYDEKHKMPKQRLQWHLVKCKSKQAHEQKGLPSYHCKYHYQHIYFDKVELEKHETSCYFQTKLAGS